MQGVIRRLKLKKIIVVIIIFSLILSIASFAIKTNEVTVGLVISSPDRELDGFDSMAVEGIERASGDFDISYTCYYPTAPVTEDDAEIADQYKDLLMQAAKENEMVIAIGFLFTEDVQRVAEIKKNTKFIAVDFSPMIDGLEIENVHTYLFKENEGSFLVGLAAAFKTNTDIIGFVGGMDFDLINRFEIGYTAGAKTVNDSIEVVAEYADSFTDFYRGYYVATKQIINNDVDVVFHAAGITGEGVIESASDFGIWAIGVDVDQSYINPESVLCSMVKRVDNAVYYAVESLCENSFEGGATSYLGILEDGVGYSDNPENLAEYYEEIEVYIDKIKLGEIVVPATYEELEAYLD